MEPNDFLMLIVEASLALAGFAGIVVAVSRGGASELPPIQRMNLVNLLAASFGALFFSLFALGMSAADVSPAAVWRWESAIGIVTIIYFGVRSIRLVLRNVGINRRNWVTVLFINVPLAAVCVAQTVNFTNTARFWPVFLLLASFFALGCYSFIRLLFSPSSRRSP